MRKRVEVKFTRTRIEVKRTQMIKILIRFLLVIPINIMIAPRCSKSA
jgi:hypothetical protein